MTKIIHFQISALIILLIGLSIQCKKELQPLPSYEKGDQIYGKASCIRNGKSWESTPYCRYIITLIPDTSKLGFSLGTYDTDGIRGEDLAILFIPKKIGEYEVKHRDDGNIDRLPHAGYFLVTDDQIDATYQLQSNRKSTINIDKIDYNTNLITGRFNL